MHPGNLAVYLRNEANHSYNVDVLNFNECNYRETQNQFSTMYMSKSIPQKHSMIKYIKFLRQLHIYCSTLNIYQTLQSL